MPRNLIQSSGGHPARGPLADSEMARRFDADVAVSAPERTLFFVMARHGSPAGPIAAAGGQTVVHFSDPRRALAMLPVAAGLALGREAAILAAAPVAIDPERFGAFARLVGLDGRDRGANDSGDSPNKED